MAADGDLALTHGFQQRGLYLGRSTVDFVSQQDGVEDRTRLEFKPSILRAPDFRTGQIGRQQVRGELDAGEIGIQARSQGADSHGLGQAGSTFHQQMAVGQQGNQQAFHQARLAHDGFRQPVTQSNESLVQAGVVATVGDVGACDGG